MQPADRRTRALELALELHRDNGMFASADEIVKDAGKFHDFMLTKEAGSAQDSNAART